MLDLYELQQFLAFGRLGTLSKVAEEFHLSTPSITRSMQHLEEGFGVPLFIREKNRIELNATGKLALEYAEKLLQEAEHTVEQVRAFAMRQKTIVIRSCAPAPLWELLRKLSTEQPEKMISSVICQNEEVLLALQEKKCDIGILPFPIEGAAPFMKEQLFVCVPREHELAQRKELSFSEINGFNFLLRTELGFWDTMCREKMPASKFLVQTDADAFNELVKESSLPCFATDYIRSDTASYYGRVNIPILDPEAKVTFYIKWCNLPNR